MAYSQVYARLRRARLDQLRWSRVSSDSGRLEVFAALLKQELSYGGVFCQADRAIVGVRGLARLPETLQEVSANRPVRLIMRHRFRVNRFQNGQSCFWSIRFRHRRGVSSSRAQCRGDAGKLLIEARDRRPLRPPGARALRVYRLNRQLRVEIGRRGRAESLGQMTFRIF